MGTLVEREREVVAARAIGDLAPRWRWTVLAGIALVALLPFVQGAQALRSDWQPVGDDALIAIRARDVLVDPPLLGQPDSADAQGASQDSAHLGPIESYLLAVPIALGGARTGSVLGAALVQASALAVALVLAFRRGGMVLFALVAAGLPVMIWSLGSGVLHDPINSDLATIALVPLALAAWSLWEDDLVTAPLFAALVALVLQPHLANAPFAAAATLIGLVGLVRSIRRGPVDRRQRIALWSALAVTVVLWLPVLIAEVVLDHSNLAAVWTSVLEPKSTMGPSFGLQRLARVVGPVPFFLQSHGVALPVGYPGVVTIVVGLLLVGVAGSLAVVLHGQGRRPQASGLAIVPVLLAVAAVAAARLPITASVRPEHGRWMWGGGLLFWAVLAWAAWSLLAEARRRAWLRSTVVVLLLIGVLGVGAVLRQPALTSNSGQWLMPRLDAFTDDIRADVPQGRYLLVPGDESSLITVTPAIALVLDEAGYRTFVVEDTFSRGYDEHHFLGDQEVDGSLHVYADAPATPPEGGTQVALAPAPDGSTGDGAGDLVAYLVPS